MQSLISIENNLTNLPNMALNCSKLVRHTCDKITTHTHTHTKTVEATADPT